MAVVYGNGKVRFRRAKLLYLVLVFLAQSSLCPMVPSYTGTGEALHLIFLCCGPDFMLVHVDQSCGQVFFLSKCICEGVEPESRGEYSFRAQVPGEKEHITRSSW